MFLAGVSESGGEKALKLWHLRNATSFNGQFCISSVSVQSFVKLTAVEEVLMAL